MLSADNMLLLIEFLLLTKVFCERHPHFDILRLAFNVFRVIQLLSFPWCFRQAAAAAKAGAVAAAAVAAVVAAVAIAAVAAVVIAAAVTVAAAGAAAAAPAAAASSRPWPSEGNRLNVMGCFMN